MRIGDGQHLEDGLNCAILPADAVQSVEDYVGSRIKGAQQCSRIPADIDRPDPVAVVGERPGAFASARQRDLTLGRPATQQKGDILALRLCAPSENRTAALKRAADPPNLPFENDTGRLEDTPPHLLAQSLEIAGGGIPGVDQEVGVL